MSFTSSTNYYKKGLIIFFGILGLMIILIIVFNLYFVKKIDNFQAYTSEEQNEEIATQLVAQLKKQEPYQNPAGSEALNYSFSATSSPIIEIVIFSDFDCPYSLNVYSKLRRLVSDFSSYLKITFRSFPTNEKSTVLAMSAYCAGEQGKFWSMHDKLFQNQGQFETSQIPLLAKEAELNIKQFETCLAQTRYTSEIEQDLEDASEMAVTGAPTLFMDGYKITGDIPYDILQGLTIGFLIEKLD